MMSNITQVVNIDSKTCIVAINSNKSIDLYEIRNDGQQKKIDMHLLPLLENISSFSVLLINKDYFLLAISTCTLFQISVCHVESGMVKAKQYIHQIKPVISKMEFLSVNCIIFQTCSDLYKFEFYEFNDVIIGLDSWSFADSISVRGDGDAVDSLLYSISPISIDYAKLKRISPLFPVTSFNNLYHDIVDFQLYPTLQTGIDSHKFMSSLRNSLHNTPESKIEIGKCALFFKDFQRSLVSLLWLSIFATCNVKEEEMRGHTTGSSGGLSPPSSVPGSNRDPGCTSSQAVVKFQMESCFQYNFTNTIDSVCVNSRRSEPLVYVATSGSIMVFDEHGIINTIDLDVGDVCVVGLFATSIQDGAHGESKFLNTLALSCNNGSYLVYTHDTVNNVLKRSSETFEACLWEPTTHPVASDLAKNSSYLCKGCEEMSPMFNCEHVPGASVMLCAHSKFGIGMHLYNSSNESLDNARSDQSDSVEYNPYDCVFYDDSCTEAINDDKPNANVRASFNAGVGVNRILGVQRIIPLRPTCVFRSKPTVPVDGGAFLPQFDTYMIIQSSAPQGGCDSNTSASSVLSHEMLFGSNRSQQVCGAQSVITLAHDAYAMCVYRRRKSSALTEGIGLDMDNEWKYLPHCCVPLTDGSHTSSGRLSRIGNGPTGMLLSQWASIWSSVYTFTTSMRPGSNGRAIYFVYVVLCSRLYSLTTCLCMEFEMLNCNSNSQTTSISETTATDSDVIKKLPISSFHLNNSYFLPGSSEDEADFSELSYCEEEHTVSIDACSLCIDTFHVELVVQTTITSCILLTATPSGDMRRIGQIHILDTLKQHMQYLGMAISLTQLRINFAAVQFVDNLNVVLDHSAVYKIGSGTGKLTEKESVNVVLTIGIAKYIFSIRCTVSGSMLSDGKFLSPKDLKFHILHEVITTKSEVCSLSTHVVGETGCSVPSPSRSSYVMIYCSTWEETSDTGTWSSLEVYCCGITGSDTAIALKLPLRTAAFATNPLDKVCNNSSFISLPYNIRSIFIMGSPIVTKTGVLTTLLLFNGIDQMQLVYAFLICPNDANWSVCMVYNDSWLTIKGGIQSLEPYSNAGVHKSGCFITGNATHFILTMESKLIQRQKISRELEKCCVGEGNKAMSNVIDFLKILHAHSSTDAENSNTDAAGISWVCKSVVSCGSSCQRNIQFPICKISSVIQCPPNARCTHSDFNADCGSHYNSPCILWFATDPIRNVVESAPTSTADSGSNTRTPSPPVSSIPLTGTVYLNVSSIDSDKGQQGVAMSQGRGCDSALLGTRLSKTLNIDGMIQSVVMINDTLCLVVYTSSGNKAGSKSLACSDKLLIFDTTTFCCLWCHDITTNFSDSFITVLSARAGLSPLHATGIGSNSFLHSHPFCTDIGQNDEHGIGNVYFNVLYKCTDACRDSLWLCSYQTTRSAEGASDTSSQLRVELIHSQSLSNPRFDDKTLHANAEELYSYCILHTSRLMGDKYLVLLDNYYTIRIYGWLFEKSVGFVLKCCCTTNISMDGADATNSSGGTAEGSGSGMKKGRVLDVATYEKYILVSRFMLGIEVYVVSENCAEIGVSVAGGRCLYLKKLHVINEPTIGFQMKSIIIQKYQIASKTIYWYCISGVTAWKNRYAEYAMYVVTGKWGDQDDSQNSSYKESVKSAPMYRLYGACLDSPPGLYIINHSNRIPSNLQDRPVQKIENSSPKQNKNRLPQWGALRRCVLDIPCWERDTIRTNSYFVVSVSYDTALHISDISTSIKS